MQEIDFSKYAIKLSVGQHTRPQDGMCIMECVAYIQGEPHTDHPVCACPVVTAYAIRLNDNASDEERDSLLPFALRIAGSRSTREVEQKRGYIAADYSVRVFTPIAMEAVGFLSLAKRLRELDPIVDTETARIAVTCITAAAPTVKAHAGRTAARAVDAAALAVLAATTAASIAANAAIAARVAGAVEIGNNVFSLKLRLLEDMLKLTEPITTTPAVEKKMQELAVVTQ